MFHSTSICVQRLWFLTNLRETCVSFHYTSDTGRLRLAMNSITKDTPTSLAVDDKLTEIETKTDNDFFKIPEKYIRKMMSYKELINYIDSKLETYDKHLDIMYSDTTSYEVENLWFDRPNSRICVSFIYNIDVKGGVIYSHKVIDTLNPSQQLILKTKREVEDMFDRNEVTISKMVTGLTFGMILTELLDDIDDNEPIQYIPKLFIVKLNRILMSGPSNSFYKFDKATGTLQYMKHYIGTPTEDKFNRHAQETTVPIRTSRNELNEIIMSL